MLDVRSAGQAQSDLAADGARSRGARIDADDDGRASRLIGSFLDGLRKRGFKLGAGVDGRGLMSLGTAPQRRLLYRLGPFAADRRGPERRSQPSRHALADEKGSRALIRATAGGAPIPHFPEPRSRFAKRPALSASLRRQLDLGEARARATRRQNSTGSHQRRSLEPPSVVRSRRRANPLSSTCSRAAIEAEINSAVPLTPSSRRRRQGSGR